MWSGILRFPYRSNTFGNPIRTTKILCLWSSAILERIYCYCFDSENSHILNRSMTKPTKWHVRPAKTLISLGIRPVWSESSLSAWRHLGSFIVIATNWMHSEGSDQSGWKPRLRVDGCPGWSEGSLGAQVILFVLSSWGSYYNSKWGLLRGALWLPIAGYQLAGAILSVRIKHRSILVKDDIKIV